MQELYKQYRPTKLDEVVGQPVAVAQLRGFLKTDSVPHAVLLHGPSGCGKTTLARIMAKELGTSDMEVREINMADDRGVDVVREIQSRLPLMPLVGSKKVYILDEFHAITPQAGQAFLKMFEDAPAHVYFFVCTSEPSKIAKALQTRLTQIAVGAVQERDIISILEAVLLKSRHVCDMGMLLKIASAASGSPRRALVILEQWIAAGATTEALEAITENQEEMPQNLINLCRELMGQGKPDWKKVYEIAKAIPETELESARWMLLRYAEKCMGSGGPVAKKAARLVAAMSKPFWDGKRPEFLAKLLMFVES